jgi:hypothetical protein
VLGKGELDGSPFLWYNRTMTKHTHDCRDKKCIGCGPDAPLKKRIKELEKENIELKESLTMSCEDPCGDCAGCNYADEKMGTKND